MFFIFLGVIFIIFIFSKVKKKIFSERESVYWMLGAIFVLILSIFPKLLDSMSVFLGIYYPPSLLFLVSILFLIIIVFRQSIQISSLNEKVKELAQREAILEQRIREKNSIL